MITHLSHQRIRTLLEAGRDLDSAAEQAEAELRAGLGVGPPGFDPGSRGVSLSVTGGDTEANAYLQVGKVSVFAGAEKMLKVVDPSKLENSSMWVKILGKPKSTGGKNVGSQMPQTGTLTTVQKQTLKDWICTGAKP